jgi:lysophospholipase L1-like esterase
MNALAKPWWRCWLLLWGLTGAAGADAARQILIVGDSTASSYPQSRYPRTGWGQALE